MKKKAFFRILAFSLILPLFCSLFLALPARADDTAYGEDAMQKLRYLNDHYPYRVNDKRFQESSENKIACGKWISEIMRGYGYAERIIEGDPARNYQSLTYTYVYTKPGASSKKIVVGAHYDSVATKGAEDNGTGVSVLLEIGKRFQDVSTPLTLEFCFFDGEETLGEAGSFAYVQEQIGKGELQDIVLYINLDSIGSGDNLFAYGGEWIDGTLVRDFGYNMAMKFASEAGIELHQMPDGVNRFKSPTRTEASDQLFFAAEHVPYLYFEANAWVDLNGNVPYQDRPYIYNTTDPRVIQRDYEFPAGQLQRTYAGQLIHARVYDDLDVLEAFFPGRIRKHLSEVSELVTRILKTSDETIPTKYAKLEVSVPVIPSTPTQAPETDKPTETEKPTETAKPTETDKPTETAKPTETDRPTEKDPTKETGSEPVEPASDHEDHPTKPSENGGSGNETRTPLPPTAAEIFLILALLALWGIWGYIYIKRFR